MEIRTIVKIQNIARRDANDFAKNASLQEIDDAIGNGSPSRDLVESSGEQQCCVYFGVETGDFKRAAQIYDEIYCLTLDTFLD